LALASPDDNGAIVSAVVRRAKEKKEQQRGRQPAGGGTGFMAKIGALFGGRGGSSAKGKAGPSASLLKQVSCSHGRQGIVDTVTSFAALASIAASFLRHFS
jgi:hypothetical protein